MRSKRSSVSLTRLEPMAEPGASAIASIESADVSNKSGISRSTIPGNPKRAPYNAFMLPRQPWIKPARLAFRTAVGPPP